MMTLVSLTDCCRLLVIDPKTLRHWLRLAHISVQPHPHDARLKCVTISQLQQVAAAHRRVLSALSGLRVPAEPCALFTSSSATSVPAQPVGPSDLEAHIAGLTSQLVELQAAVTMLERQLNLLSAQWQKGADLPAHEALTFEHKSQESSQDNAQQFTHDKSQKSSQGNAQQFTQDKSQESALDKSVEVAQDKSQESSQGNAQQFTQDKSQESALDKSVEVAQDKSQESSQGNAQQFTQDKSQESALDKSVEVAQDKSQESALDNTQQFTHDKSQESALNKSQKLASASIDRRKYPRVLPLVEYAGESHYVVISPEVGKLDLEPDSPEWFAWLATLPSFRFVGKNGHLTAFRSYQPSSKQAWCAHRQIRNRSYRHRLGQTPQVTLASLEMAAASLHAHV